MKKQKFLFPVYGYVPVEAQVRGNIVIQANNESEAKEIAKSIAGKNFKDLPTSCELDENKLVWDDELHDFDEYVEHELLKQNIVKIRINDDDIEDVEIVE